MESFIEVVISAFPWLKGVVDVARVVVWALPNFAMPIWLFGLIGGGFLIYAWRELA